MGPARICPTSTGWGTATDAGRTAARHGDGPYGRWRPTRTPARHGDGHGHGRATPRGRTAAPSTSSSSRYDVGPAAVGNDDGGLASPAASGNDHGRRGTSSASYDVAAAPSISSFSDECDRWSSDDSAPTTTTRARCRLASTSTARPWRPTASTPTLTSVSAEFVHPTEA